MYAICLQRLKKIYMALDKRLKMLFDTRPIEILHLITVTYLSNREY